MAKKNKFLDWIFWIVGVVTSLGIAGLFMNGTFMNTIFLSWIPQIVHTIVGWILVVSLVLEIFKKFK